MTSNNPAENKKVGVSYEKKFPPVSTFLNDFIARAVPIIKEKVLEDGDIKIRSKHE